VSLVSSFNSDKFKDKRVALSGPLKVIYIDWRDINWNQPQQTLLDASASGYNVLIMAFYLSSGSAADMCQAWEELDDGTKSSTIQQIHNNGTIVLASLGGSTDVPFDKDPSTLGTQVAQWVQANYLDGVDFDLENLSPNFIANGMTANETVSWVVEVSEAARLILGPSGYITHAPQAPYFGPIGSTQYWAGPTGGYSGVNQLTKSIDWYNIQFYNQGTNCYVDFNGLFLSSCSNFPKTSVSEIAATGVNYDMIVIGKPVETTDAGSGWVAASDLGSWFSQANSQLGWNTGVMGWEWGIQSDLITWIHSIYP